jgi:hypothetical protein
MDIDVDPKSTVPTDRQAGGPLDPAVRAADLIASDRFVERVLNGLRRGARQATEENARLRMNPTGR